MQNYFNLVSTLQSDYLDSSNSNGHLTLGNGAQLISHEPAADGALNGNAEIVWPNENRYVGNFESNQPQGEGSFIW